MPQRWYLEVDPRTLHLPGSRLGGADPHKLQRQVAKYGSSRIGIPPPLVYRGSDGALMLNDGVTRTARIAKLTPGVTIHIEVIRTLRVPLGRFPTIRDTHP